MRHGGRWKKGGKMTKGGSKEQNMMREERTTEQSTSRQRTSKRDTDSQREQQWIIALHSGQVASSHFNHRCALESDGYVSERCDSKWDDLRKNFSTSQPSRSLRAQLGETDDWEHSAVQLCRVPHTSAFHFSTWSASFARQNEMGLTSSSHMASHVLLWGTESSLSFSKTGAVLHDLAHSLKNGHPFSKACNKPFQLISYLLGSRCFPGSIWKSTQKWLCEILDLTIFILFFLSFRLSFARSSFFPILCQKLTRCLCIWHHIFFFFFPMFKLGGLKRCWQAQV